MKPSRNFSGNNPTTNGLVAFGAHPDDVEFGAGGVLAAAAETMPVHLVICSRGESATHGTPEGRVREAEKAAKILGATVEFILLDGDAQLEHTPKHSRALAAVIRRCRPSLVLAPTPVENQHPDHARLARIVRDAARLARYGGVRELRDQPPHSIAHLLFYAITAEAEPASIQPILIDVSAPRTLLAWRRAMAAHGSQSATRPYSKLQLARARTFGLRAGVRHAMALFPNDPLLFPSLSALTAAAPAAARRF